MLLNILLTIISIAMIVAYPILLLPAASASGAPNNSRNMKIFIWSYIGFITLTPPILIIWLLVRLLS